jgi:hypothetical protein
MPPETVAYSPRRLLENHFLISVVVWGRRPPSAADPALSWSGEPCPSVEVAQPSTNGMTRATGRCHGPGGLLGAGIGWRPSIHHEAPLSTATVPLGDHWVRTRISPGDARSFLGGGHLRMAWSRMR